MIPVVGAPVRQATWPVIEVFGPVIQGEGALAGAPTHFIRFGGCDYRCSWCDSMYAVDPAQVRDNSVRMGVDEIVDRLDALGRPAWVTLSGGNPAIHRLGPLVARLQDRFRVCVETQGSKWRDWLADVDCLTVSPKGPSSGMDVRTDRDLDAFMRQVPGRGDLRDDALKIVVFDEEDLGWARQVFARYPRWPRYLSCGTDPPAPGETRDRTLRLLADRYRWLCEAVSGDLSLTDVRVLPQLHVVAFGHARGV